jgi:eukaryotic-like serine/threonine-protein kinase
MGSHPPPLPETLAGHYRIDRVLGSGGMATVYLAHDLRHDRLVALKVVKPEIVAGVGADRFITEIRTTAHLKHPHILPLFDSGSVGDALFYVMPYIDGESLRARLRRDGPLPLTDTATILRELADALAYAHTQGVVHRDIKPDNVLLSGRHVFLADFGIARALEAGATGDQTVTATSTIVGTPTYLSPEQAAGLSHVDHRADIYSLGVMAYEMLAGVPPFAANTAAAVMAAHITTVPESLLDRRPDVPPALAALIMKCLAKRPEDRWQRMDDLLVALDAASGPHSDARTAAGFRRRSVMFGAGAGVAAAILIAIPLGWLLWTTRADVLPAIGALKHVTRDPGLELDPAISPDGKTLAYVAGLPGQRRLYVRQIDGGRAIALTDAAVAPSQRRPDWSPDGTRIVFQAGNQGFGVRPEVRDGALYTIPALGGTPTLLLPPGGAGVATSPAWSRDATRIAYCADDGVYVIGASGGSPRRVVTAARAHSPRWSADGARLVYVVGGWTFALGEEQLGNTETSAIRIVSVDTGAEAIVTAGQWVDVSPVWTPDDRGLLFVSNRSGGRDVYRQRLSRSGAPDGDPERVTSGLNAHAISLSPDGKRLAYSSLAFHANIWSLAIPHQGVASLADAQQVTFGSEKTEKLVVSRDGQWLAFDSDRGGSTDVWKVRIAGGEPEQVTRDPGPEFVNDWSPDGLEILFHTIRSATNRDVMSVTADGTRTSVVIATSAEEQQGAWSPDGNSIAFSNGTGGGADLYNVSVLTRAGQGSPWGPPRRLSSDTGIDARWSPDGSRIVYIRRGEVHVMRRDGRDDRVLARPSMVDQARPQYAIWSRDGHTIYFKAAESENRAGIWAVPAAGGTAQLMVRLDDPQRPSLRREFTTDGTRFFFTITQDEGDIWVAEVK